MFYEIIYTVSIVGIVVTALMVMFRNKTANYRTFALFALVLALWIALQFVAQILYLKPVIAKEILDLTPLVACLIPYSFALFSLHYLDKKFRVNESAILGIIPAVLIMMALLWPPLKQVEINREGIAIKDATVIYGLILFYALVYFIISGTVIYRKYHRGSALERANGKVLLIAILQVALANIIAAIFFADLMVTQLVVPLSCFLMVLLIGYAMIKHKLFDIRVVVARSVVYTLLFVVLALIFIATSMVLVKVFLPSGITQTQQLLIDTVIALVLALATRPLKNYFDRTTNKIFFRDAYDTQDVLDKTGMVFIGNIDSQKIQSGVLEILNQALKPSFIGFLLRDSMLELVPKTQIGAGWRQDSVVALGDELERSPEKLIIFDEIESDTSKLKNALRKNDIAVAVPLVTRTASLGYLVLGPKRSGNIYNSQDMKLLNIVSNELAIALQNAQRFDEIRDFNTTLQKKVDQATRELRATNKKLIALDEAKDEFISMASHQLRTPLTSIKGYVSMMLEGDLGKLSESQKKALKESFTSSQRMAFLISDFLNVSRLKTGKFIIEPSSVDLSKIVSEELSQLSAMAKSRDIKLIYDPPSDLPIIELDENKVRQVMMNMVDNAIYYTPSGGKVTIQLYSTDRDIIFKVVDTGIGVPRSEHAKMFTKFYRAKNAQKVRPDGTGLGLFMAQKVVVAQGGSTIFESKEGKGSTFGFRFPIKKRAIKSRTLS